MSILGIVEKYGKYNQISAGELAGPCPQCGGAMRFRITLAENQGRCDVCFFVIDAAVPEVQEKTGGTAAITYAPQRAERLLKDSMSRIAAAYSAAAWDWLEKRRPDAVVFIRGQQKCVEACLDQKDEERLVKSLDTLEKAYLRAWALYEGREPVIEREAPDQPVLFDGSETCNAYQPE